MLTQEVAKEKSAFASAVEGQVLAALSAVPMDKARLFEVVVRRGHWGRGRSSRWRKAAEEVPLGFFDTLAILQAGGLISRTAHPLEDRRLYYLTERGSELAREAVVAKRRKPSRSRTERVGS